MIKVVASELNKRYANDIKILVAKRRLVSNTPFLLSEVVFDFAYTLYRGKEFHFIDDLSIDCFYVERFREVISNNGIECIYTTYNARNEQVISGVSTLSYSCVYSDINMLQVCNTSNAKIIDINYNGNIQLHNFSSVEACKVGVDIKLHDNTIRIRTSGYSLLNCFNNCYYKNVYLSKKLEEIDNCFNNCVIDNFCSAVSIGAGTCFRNTLIKSRKEG